MIRFPEVPKCKENEPHALMSVYINEDGKVEEIELVNNFVGGKNASNMESDYYESIDESLFKDLPKDTLYHVYIKLIYSSYWTDCGTEYDMDVEVLNIIAVHSNYTEFLRAQEEYEEKVELRNNDNDCFEYEGYFNYREVPNITFNDLQKIGEIIAKDNIRLAHRILGKHYAKKVLGNKYNEELAEIETRREAFRDYLRNDNGSFVFNRKDGYELHKKGKVVNVSFEQIIIFLIFV